MRRTLLVLAAIVGWCVPVWAAQPTLTMDSFTSSSTSVTTVSVTMTAGQAVVVAYIKSSTSNRTVTITDDSGANVYESIVDTGNCATARCVEVFADYSVTGGTFTITATQSGTHVSYRLWVLKYTCGTSCEEAAVSFLVNGSDTTHESSADSTVIDAPANSTVVSVCTGR